MSKVGVAKTQEFRKPRKRKRVRLEERMVNGEVVVGKECTNCGEWKPLSNGFYGDVAGLGGRYSQCKGCKTKRSSTWVKENKEKHATYNLKWNEGNKEKIQVLGRKWYEENREKKVELVREWQQNNSDKVKLICQRRRARKKALPDTWTLEQKEKMLEYFERKCALTGEDDITEEHAIPISIGHGGTIHGNMWPLCHRLNSSKHNKNIFEWFEANRQRFELSQERFDRLIAWLAAANDMTVDEYRDYVYWCHAHPNDVLESEAI
ncbi:hypothetical protein [Bacillus cereus]|uniref:hypothetical protein n=1 Tax=Bacillus cereus TaxID=1396 RepID=UPI0034D6BC2B